MAAIAEDFDEYVNGQWRRKVTIPAESGSYSVSDEIEDALFANLRTICRAATGPVGTFYASGMASRAQQRGITAVRELLARIDCVRDTDDVLKATIEHNKKGFMSTFQIVVAPDSRDTSIHCIHLSEGDVPISNLDLYRNRKTTIMKQYTAYLKRVGKHFSVPLENVLEIESMLALALVADDDHGHPDRRYLRRTPAQLQEDYKFIPWTTLWHTLGQLPEYVLVPCQRYYAAIDRMFREFTIDQWRVLLKSQVIHSLIKYLPPPFDELHFSFYGRALHGDTRKLPQEKLVIECVKQGIPDALGQLYVKHIGTKQAAAIKRNVTGIFTRLQKTMAAHIESNTWMDPHTRTAALKKVHNMIGKIAYPSHWTIYHGLALQPLEFVRNIVICNEWAWQAAWAKLDKPVNREQWTNGCLEVNAYYYPEENSIVMPIGILQPPFYDLRKSVAWNMGGIGCVIGHEICHGFDNEGREYDASGNLSKWWTPEDHRRFSRHAHELQALLSSTKHAGSYVDGPLTLAEAIADLTGMRIALNAALATDASIAAQREFFISYAVSWRKKERPKYARDVLATDVHPPARVRINLTVAQIPEWYVAFGLKQKDELLPLVI